MTDDNNPPCVPPFIKGGNGVKSLDDFSYFLLWGDKRKYQRKTPFVLLWIYPFHGGRTTGFLACLDDDVV